MTSIGARGIGLGFRPELAADMFAAGTEIDFVEVVAEACFARTSAWREAQALAEIWPVIPHGVKLSLGSADGIDASKARRLGDLARDLRAPVVTEHVAMTRGGGREIGHLTAIPCTPEAVSVIAKNVATARRHLPDVPLLLENIAWSLRWPEDTMDEGSFYEAVVRATGCELLLDVANLYANALNSGRDPAAFLDTFPLDRVAMVHVAGGVTRNGFYEDTHAHAVPPEVLDLLARLLSRTGPLPVLLERDSGFPPWAEVKAELLALRKIHSLATERVPHPTGGARSGSAETIGVDHSRLSEGLAARQAALAVVLTTDAPHAIPGFDQGELSRTRLVLQNKRVENALPLLPRLGRIEGVHPLALAALLKAPVSAHSPGIADARRLADVLADQAPFAALARFDRLELRSRFDARNQARFLPFVGREALPSKGSVWAFKGPGRKARTHFLEWRRHDPKPAGP